jgi:hypothetical protein
LLIERDDVRVEPNLDNLPARQRDGTLAERRRKRSRIDGPASTSTTRTYQLGYRSRALHAGRPAAGDHARQLALPARSLRFECREFELGESSVTKLERVRQVFQTDRMRFERWLAEVTGRATDCEDQRVLAEDLGGELDSSRGELDRRDLAESEARLGLSWQDRAKRIRDVAGSQTDGCDLLE